MPKYLVESSYTAEGAKGLAKDGGSNRRKMVKKMVESMGGTLEAFYFAFGGADVWAIIDVPDNVTVAAMSLAIHQNGAVALKTHVLMTPEEMDKAAKKSAKVRAPGK